MTVRWLRMAALVPWVAATVINIPVAEADNCTGAGDFGAAAGCAAPGDGSGKTESWPPTSVDWPPDFSSDSDTAGKGTGQAAATPIVRPTGQPAPHTRSPAGQGDSPSTSTSPTPIGAAGGAPSTAVPTSTPIVAPTAPTP
ncbi:hypothetical protein [Mycobacterium aquaticum]|uniref:Uncharacterized protein n=1 Tax=Mycobacterium aquaticum TaxID=1927124 RepID=A0A1X0B893_9MYCO|nr:hypothetical protein [Mycobacterium aquaticum]ORA38542.1 hypothetical protein BST13_03865 [Mycobacterium aquaticum]